MQPPYDHLDGVIDTVVGYTGGKTLNPTYESISSGKTGHREAVQITFDPDKTSYEELVTVFWHNIDPTNDYGQFADRGSQYRTAIYYHSESQRKAAEASKTALENSNKFNRPIVTDILPAETFYPAEDYHQDYYKNHPLRYSSYKKGSGREDYILNTWKKN